MPKVPDADSACSSLEDPELAQLSAAILALGGDLPEDLRSLPPDISSLPTARLPGPETFHPSNTNPGGSNSLPWPGNPAPGLPRFFANLPPPEVLARIAHFPTSGGLPTQGAIHRGPFPQIPPQMPPQASLPAYQPPTSQVAQPGPVVPTSVRPSTTTVDSIQAPIPSYASTSHHHVPPPTSVGYSVPPQLAAYPHFVPQPGITIPSPSQTPLPQSQQQKHSQHYPQPTGQPLPQGYQPGPGAIPGPHLPLQQTFPQGYIPPQPSVPPQYQQPFPCQPHPQNGFQIPIPQGYQPRHGFVPQQYPQMTPGNMPRPSQHQMPPQTVHPQIPPTSQPTPPISQPYLPHPNPQVPIGHPHQNMLPQQQHIPMPSNIQQITPHPQLPVPGGPRAQGPPTSQPVSQNYMPPNSQPIHPNLHQQMPPASQPHMVPCPQTHLPRGPNMPQMPLNAPPQPHQPIPGQQPFQMPNQAQIQHPPTAGVCYPGGSPMMPQQPLAPQPAAPQQPQATLTMTHPQPPTMYPAAQGATVPSAQQPAAMIQPSPGGPSATQSPNTVPHSLTPSPSPAPSPGPTCLGLNPQQRPTPALTPGGTAPPTLPSPSAISPTTSLFQRQNSSTDDLLSSSPESQAGGNKAPTNVLQPTKADPQDGERRKKSSQGVLLIQGDPYQAPERVALLYNELERYRAQVDSLEQPCETEGGLSVLDARWKELQDQQEKDARQLSIAIARCYTMKNRHQDVMPYDLNRVVLQSGKDDYINASYVEDLSPYCPRLIATQAPLTGTAADFWLMVYEQKVSLIVMLVSEQELDKVMKLFVFLVI